MPTSEFLRDFFGSLADDFKASHKGTFQGFILLKLVDVQPAAMTLDVAGLVGNMTKILTQR